MSVAGLAADRQGVWIGDIRRTRLVRLDPGFRVRRCARCGSRRQPRDSASSARTPWRSATARSGPDAPTGPWRGSMPTSHEVTARISVGNDPSAIATGAGGVWVTDAEDNTVTRLDPASEGAVIATTSVGQGPDRAGRRSGRRMGGEHAGRHRLADRPAHRAPSPTPSRSGAVPPASRSERARCGSRTA